MFDDIVDWLAIISICILIFIGCVIAALILTVIIIASFIFALCMAPFGVLMYIFMGKENREKFIKERSSKQNETKN